MFIPNSIPLGLGISQPRSREDVQSVVRAARKDRKAISVANGRHATSSAHLISKAAKLPLLVSCPVVDGKLTTAVIDFAGHPLTEFPGHQDV